MGVVCYLGLVMVILQICTKKHAKTRARHGCHGRFRSKTCKNTSTSWMSWVFVASLAWSWRFGRARVRARSAKNKIYWDLKVRFCLSGKGRVAQTKKTIVQFCLCGSREGSRFVFAVSGRGLGRRGVAEYFPAHTQNTEGLRIIQITKNIKNKHKHTELVTWAS
jgi:hypothetical protein